MIKGKVYKKRCRHCGSFIEYYHGDKPDVCPFCNKSDAIKPDTETELFLLQEAYLKTRDGKVLSEMYLLLKKYARSKIKKMLNGAVIFSEDKLDEKSSDAVNLLVEYYLNKPSFKIETSFMGYLTWQVQSVLYNKKEREEDEHDSLNRMIDDSTKKELGEVLPSEMIIPFHHDYHEADLIEGLCKIVKDIHSEIRNNYSSRLATLVLIGINHFIEGKSDEFKNKFFNMYGRIELKNLVDKSMLLIYQFIKESDFDRPA